MTTQKWWWPTLALMVVLLSTVVGSASKGPCATGHLVIPANETKSLPAAIDNKPGPPMFPCYHCAYMVISANTQTQIIFHCFYDLIKLVRPMFPSKDRKQDGKYHFFWKDLPSTGESMSVRREISPSMTFKDALDEHKKIFPPSNASTITGFHCFHGKFKAKFYHYQMILGHLRPIHIQSTDPKMRCSIKVAVSTKGEWFSGGSTIEYGSVEQHLCPKKGCEQNEDGKSAICCCHGSGCNNAPLMYAVTWTASARRRGTSTPTGVTAPPKITTASTTSQTTTIPDTTTATEPSTTADENESTSATTTTSSVTTAGENTIILWVALITISVLLLLALLALMVVVCVLMRRPKAPIKKKNDDSTVVVLGPGGSFRLRNNDACDDENSANNSLTTTEDAPKSKAYTT